MTKKKIKKILPGVLNIDPQISKLQNPLGGCPLPTHPNTSKSTSQRSPICGNSPKMTKSSSPEHFSERDSQFWMIIPRITQRKSLKKNLSYQPTIVYQLSLYNYIRLYPHSCWCFDKTPMNYFLKHQQGFWTQVPWIHGASAHCWVVFRSLECLAPGRPIVPGFEVSHTGGIDIFLWKDLLCRYYVDVNARLTRYIRD